MGTRADFYVGKGKDAEWLGSIAWDGHPTSIAKNIFNAPNEGVYRERVESFLSKRGDGTKPRDGWPWPWEDSNTTDYAYAWDHGKVIAWSFGAGPFDPLDEPEESTDGKSEFPNMKERQKITLGKRSGVIIVQGK